MAAPLFSHNCRTEREAGCSTCWGDEVRWEGDKAEAAAANHARNNSGHHTWADISQLHSWGPPPPYNPPAKEVENAQLVYAEVTRNGGNFAVAAARGAQRIKDRTGSGKLDEGGGQAL